jgi:TDG/mug DNA glycosylase family protein
MSVVLPDYLAPNLRAIFCGTAVATASRDRGGYYAGPGNEFWSYLFDSGLTTKRLDPDSSERVLEFRLGLTDLIKDMASSSDSGLSGYDVRGFARKVERYRPVWVAFHGKTAAKQVAKYLRESQEVGLGIQAWKVAGCSVYVLPSASGSNRDPLRLEGKSSRLAWFKDFAKTLDRSESQAIVG